MTVLCKMIAYVPRHICRHMSTRHKSILQRSREAQRQLTMGWQLDPVHMEAPSVPILDSIFDDKDIYSRASDTLASAKWPFVTPETPYAGAPSEIKGANVLFIQSLFQGGHKLMRQCKARLQVPDVMTLLYFPPWHPVALGRKSRPALSVIPMQGSQYNGNTPALRISTNGARLSRNPLDYAVWRTRTGRMMRHELFASAHTVPGFRDGLYISLIKRMPTKEQAQNAISRFTQSVAASQHEWADKQLTSLNLAAINKRLTSARYSPVVDRTRRADWEPSIGLSKSTTIKA